MRILQDFDIGEGGQGKSLSYYSIIGGTLMRIWVIQR